MKKIVLLLTVALLCSCAKDTISTDVIDENSNKTITEQEALASFAKILSKAVSSNDELRAFINNVLTSGYSVRPVDFGAFSITFLPKDIRY